jgi:CRP-like cAMP-binding protein
MASHTDNLLLAMLPNAELVGLGRHLRQAELKEGTNLAEPGDDIRTVYFPHSGIISFMVETADHHTVQTGMVGRDGVVGAAQALDDKLSINKIVVQLPGLASAIDRDALRQAASAESVIRKLLATYEQFFVAEIQQTAACNAVHTAEARMCRWMLRMTDLIGREMPLTQEYLAAMIGVGRSLVSGIASDLQTKGLISYNRGSLRIEDVSGLKQHACACHQAVKDNYTMLFEKGARRDRRPLS